MIGFLTVEKTPNKMKKEQSKTDTCKLNSLSFKISDRNYTILSFFGKTKYICNIARKKS